MATLYRNTGAEDSSFPLNPSFPSGGQSQDLNVLTIISSGTVYTGNWKRPDTPSGWELLEWYAGAASTYESHSSGVAVYMYVKVGAFTGPLGEITWSGSGSMPAYAIAAIDIFGCSVGDTWDWGVYGIGGSKGHKHTSWSSPPTCSHSWYSATSYKRGTQGSGRVDLGPGDMVFVMSAFNSAQTGYPLIETVNGSHVTNDNAYYYPGPGVSGTFANVDNAYVGTATQNDGLTLVRSHFKADTVKRKYGSPQFITGLHTPACGSTIFARFGLRNKTSADTSTSSEVTKYHGIFSGDTGSGSESSRDLEPLNANLDFENGVQNWTGSNGATLSQSLEQYKIATASMKITPNGVTSTPTAVSEEVVAVPNSRYQAHAWIRGNGLPIYWGINWYNSAHSLISTASVALDDMTDGVWKEKSHFATAPAGTAYARIVTYGSGVVASSSPWYLDDAYIQDGSARRDTKVPYPRTWNNGEVPTAAVLNADWRDTFNWMLGTTRPWFSGSCTDTGNWSTGWHEIPINVEVRKRGGMVHTPNDTRVYVPEDGWYDVLACVSRDSTGAGINFADTTAIMLNGTGEPIVSGTHMPHLTDQDKVNTADPFKIYLNAGDFIELVVLTTAGAGTHKNWIINASTYSFLEIWLSER